LKRLTEELADLGDVEVAPKMEGYQMFTILSPKKSKRRPQSTRRRRQIGRRRGRETEENGGKES